MISLYTLPSMSRAWPADLEHKAPDVSTKKTFVQEGIESAEGNKMYDNYTTNLIVSFRISPS